MTSMIRPVSCPGGGGGCSRRRPEGRGATGCAFRGAKMALQPIADAAHLVHGPASCETGSWDFRPTESSGPGLHRLSLTTDLGPIDTIRGGEAKLQAAIDAVIARHDPPAVFVYQTCLPALIGDDVAGVCREAGRRWSRPVIAVDAAGFTGSRPYGTHVAGQVLLDAVVGTREPDHITATDVVLIGEFNLAGELDGIRRLLGRLGVRVVASISGDGRFDAIAAAHRARAVLSLCSQGLAGLAEGLADRYGNPVAQGSFHGTAATSETLRRLAALLAGGAADLPGRAEALIRGEEMRVGPRLAAWRSRLAGKRVLLLAGGVKSWSIARALAEAGMTVVGTSANKASAEDRARLAGLAPELKGWSPADLDARLRGGVVDVVLGGGATQFAVLKAGVPWVEINHERDFALTGYDGAVALLERIGQALASPIWEQVRRPAPWEAAPAATATVVPFRRQGGRP